MAASIDTDICIIGAGSAGLSVAAGAVQMGARVVLIEKGEMGGDCLNYGCVPSKALLAAAKHAHAMTAGAPFGVAPARAEVDFVAAMDHVHSVIAAIEPNDSQDRFEKLGVTVIREPARFVGPADIEAGATRIHARRVVVATGSSPVVPPIDGLNTTPYFTNETIFANRERPDHLVIVGGGPIGMEMAQAHARLGSAVTVLERSTVLPKDDPELRDVVKASLTSDGVVLREGVEVSSAAKTERGIAVIVDTSAGTERIEGSHLLVATGRKPNLEGLDLEAAGIAYDRSGITIDSRLRTSNKKVFAIGDVAGGMQFTHVAGYHAGIVIRNALFRWPAKADMSAIPWVTYTDPELAHVGLTEAEARETHGETVRVLTWLLKENDRALAERATDGLIKVVTRGNGQILGASIVAPGAGELIHPWVLAMSAGLKIASMASYVAPYPTLGEISKRAAGSYYTPRLFGDGTRRLVRLLLKLG